MSVANDLSVHLALRGSEPLDRVIAAIRRVIARHGKYVVMDSWALSEVERELYTMALEEPEPEVFV